MDGTGTGVTPKINSYIKDTLKIPVITICQKPFKFEGEKRQKIYNEYVAKFKETSNKIYINKLDIDYYEQQENYNGKISISQLFKLSDETMVHFLIDCLNDIIKNYNNKGKTI